MKFNFENFSGQSIGKPTKVKRWYDRHVRSWVLQVTDDNGFQIGQAVYVGTKGEAIDEEARLIREVKAGEWDNL